MFNSVYDESEIKKAERLMMMEQSKLKDDGKPRLGVYGQNYERAWDLLNRRKQQSPISDQIRNFDSRGSSYSEGLQHNWNSPIYNEVSNLESDEV